MERIALFKSVLSLIVLAVALFSMWSMYEVWGSLKSEGKNIARLKKLHRLSGILYSVLFLFISYYCFKYMALSRVEPGPRAVFHAVFSLSIAVLLILKVSYIRIWKKYYARAQMLGTLIGLITLGMIGTSAGYYFLVTNAGRDKWFDEEFKRKMERATSGERALIEEGRSIFQNTCSVCHDPNSTNTIIGPGLKGILKRGTLPVSGRPAIPANIRRQVKTPYRDMPVYGLKDEEISAIIAYFNTL